MSDEREDRAGRVRDRLLQAAETMRGYAKDSHGQQISYWVRFAGLMDKLAGELEVASDPMIAELRDEANRLGREANKSAGEARAAREKLRAAAEALIMEIGSVGPELFAETVDRAVALIRELREGVAAPHEKLGDVPPVDVMKETKWPTVEAGGVPVRGVGGERADRAAPPYSDETIRTLQLGGFGPLLNAMHCTNCGGSIDHAQADLRVEIENRNQLHGRLDEARGEAEVAKRELEESRAETAAAMTDLDAVKAAMEALRKQLQRERADVQPALAAMSRALAEKQAECDEWRRRGADTLERWAAETCDSLNLAGLRAGDELRERLMDPGPGLDVKVDDGGQAVPVCPVCGEVKERRLHGQRQYSCDCLSRESRGRWLYVPEWWQRVAVHTKCTVCGELPVLRNGELEHGCPAGGPYSKEPREWYARHGGAGEQATDEAP